MSVFSGCVTGEVKRYKEKGGTKNNITEKWQAYETKIK